MSILRSENNLTASINGKFQGRNYTSIYVLGQRRTNYPAANVLHDICDFTLQRPSGAPDNYRIYTPSTNTYGIEVVGGANDTLAGIGVRRVRIHYLDTNWELRLVDVDMTGVTPVVAVASGVRRIVDFHSLETGTLSVAGNDILLRTTLASTIEAPWTGQQTLGFIAQGGNKDMTAIFTVPEGKEAYIEFLSVSSVNQNQSIRVRSNVDPITRELIQANTFLFQSIDLMGADDSILQNFNDLRFPSRADIKVVSSPINTSAETGCHVMISMVDKI